MYTAKMKDVNNLIKWGQNNDVVKLLVKQQTQLPISMIAYYAPSQANWCYQIGLASVGGIVYELVTQFGAVVGGRERYIPSK